jgi:hypothetical protein
MDEKKFQTVRNQLEGTFNQLKYKDKKDGR